MKRSLTKNTKSCFSEPSHVCDKMMVFDWSRNPDLSNKLRSWRCLRREMNAMLRLLCIRNLPPLKEVRAHWSESAFMHRRVEKSYRRRVCRSWLSRHRRQTLRKKEMDLREEQSMVLINKVRVFERFEI
ncbi:hypothetical protein Ddye_000548 [Dipteronia dyeriana]|uniref:Uncharacterized protein n=1 Tax=Dipteronia dyeriana TaxID=168575 RepID=A0AAE0CSQ2_9ROSI|nr:hypothetical protein Ddye_000548 [Dipteronia dyeriana]